MLVPYCPAINETLIDATADYRNGKISVDIWKNRLAARQAYELKRKESPNAEGHVRLQCQAAGSCSTVKYQLKPKSETGNSAKPRIHVPVEIVDHPPSICRQQSVVFPPDAGAKYLQPLTYQSDEWGRKYKMLRSTIEGANGYAKDAGFENMHDARRRRMRGTAMQTVLVALQLFGSNLRKIDGFIRDLRLTLERNERAAGRRPRRRRTTAIQTYLPTPVGASP